LKANALFPAATTAIIVHGYMGLLACFPWLIIMLRKPEAMWY
jgi:hypothetical protein